MKANMTIGTVAREVGVCAQTIRSYADAGFIPCERDSVGRRMFGEDSIRIARNLLNRKRQIVRRSEMATAIA